MSVWRLVVFITLFTASLSVQAQMKCGDIFASPLTQTDRAIEDLARLRLSLDLALANGSSKPTFTALRQSYTEKETQIAKLFEQQGLMSRTELRKRISASIKIIQSSARSPDPTNEERERRKAVRDLIAVRKIDGNRLIFHEIKPGAFIMRDFMPPFAEHPTEITKPYALAATLTTQVVWRKIAEAALRRNVILWDLNPDPSAFKGDLRPVERVSFEDIELWIKALNALSQADDPIVKELIPEHKKGFVYRLPTQAEWEFVAHARGAIKDLYYFGQDRNEGHRFGWFNKTSNGTTHPVALKEPFLVDGQEFYDLYGNVQEVLSDWLGNTLTGGKDPKGPEAGTSRAALGGNFNGNPEAVIIGWIQPDLRMHWSGFRLARDAQ
jgi:formylglycine-generating enzyme required for sulfatase activity